MMNEKILTVSQLNDYVTGIMVYDPILRNVALVGEVSGVKQSTSGHLYFSLKDEDALIRCVMFDANEDMVATAITSGEEVVVRGHVSLYAKTGEYQLYVDEIHKQRQSDAYQAFEMLKEKLAEQHYFDETRKKPIPAFPMKVGVVTSATGAVLHDIINVAKRRASIIPICVAPSSVQGTHAVAELVSAVNELQKPAYGVDVIIVARGGGSMEDLQAFNSEELADAIYESSIPIVSAVGHETDFTIADFVADLRAPTPSAAAELVFPNVAELQLKLEKYRDALEYQMNRIMMDASETINSKKHQLLLFSPEYRIQTYQQKNANLYEKMLQMKERYFQKQAFELQQRFLEMQLRSPQHILQRGYAIIEKENQSIASINELHMDDTLDVVLAQGRVQVKVLKIMEENNKV